MAAFGKILLIKDLKGGYRRRRFARIFYEKLLKFIVEFIDLCVSLSFSHTHSYTHSFRSEEKESGFRSRNIQLRCPPSGNRNCFRNYSEYRFTRRDARISWKVPKEESDSVGSSRELLHRSFVASKSRESYNEEIFASGALAAPRALN